LQCISRAATLIRAIDPLAYQVHDKRFADRTPPNASVAAGER
jgi:hypothetical protein